MFVSIRFQLEPSWHRLSRRKRQAARRLFGQGQKFDKEAESSFCHFGQTSQITSQSVGSFEDEINDFCYWKDVRFLSQVAGSSGEALHELCSSLEAGNAETSAISGKAKVQKQESGEQGTKEKEGRVRRQGSEESKKGQEVDNLVVDAAEVPWIASTPTTRMEQGSEEPPKEETGKESVGQQTTGATWPKKMLELLKEVQINFGGTLPVELQTKMHYLQEEVKAKQSEKALQHAHLHKLKKMGAQLQSVHAKVSATDKQWNAFHSKVLEKFAQPARDVQSEEIGHCGNLPEEEERMVGFHKRSLRSFNGMLKAVQEEHLEAGMTDHQLAEPMKIFSENEVVDLEAIYICNGGKSGGEHGKKWRGPEKGSGTCTLSRAASDFTEEAESMNGSISKLDGAIIFRMRKFNVDSMVAFFWNHLRLLNSIPLLRWVDSR